MWGGIYQSPTPAFKIVFYSNQGGEALALVPLSYASDSGAARIYQRGAKARERSDRAGGGCGHGREIFENSCMKTAFSCTLNAIIRSSLCSDIDQFHTLSFFFYFWICLRETFSLSFSFFPRFFIFPFPPPPLFFLCPFFPFSFFSFPPFFPFPPFFTRRSTGGHGPLVPPLATPVAF